MYILHISVGFARQIWTRWSVWSPDDEIKLPTWHLQKHSASLFREGCLAGVPSFLSETRGQLFWFAGLLWLADPATAYISIVPLKLFILKSWVSISKHSHRGQNLRDSFTIYRIHNWSLFWHILVFFSSSPFPPDTDTDRARDACHFLEERHLLPPRLRPDIVRAAGRRLRTGRHQR